MSDNIITTTTTQPSWTPPPPRKRHRVRNTVLWISGVGIVLIAGISAISGAASSGSSQQNSSIAQGSSSSAPATQPSTQAPPAAPAAPAPTMAQQQALTSAQGYLSDGQGFSKAGLIDQLSSSAGEGFSHSDAVWAVKHSGANWKEQAVISAKGYMSDGQGFSRQGLIDQLSSSAGGGFSLAQATYAADQVGL